MSRETKRWSLSRPSVDEMWRETEMCQKMDASSNGLPGFSQARWIKKRAWSILTQDRVLLGQWMDGYNDIPENFRRFSSSLPLAYPHATGLCWVHLKWIEKEKADYPSAPGSNATPVSSFSLNVFLKRMSARQASSFIAWTWYARWWAETRIAGLPSSDGWTLLMVSRING